MVTVTVMVAGRVGAPAAAEARVEGIDDHTEIAVTREA